MPLANTSTLNDNFFLQTLFKSNFGTFNLLNQETSFSPQKKKKKNQETSQYLIFSLKVEFSKQD